MNSEAARVAHAAIIGLVDVSKLDDYVTPVSDFRTAINYCRPGRFCRAPL